MTKGDRANLERLLRSAWEKQTAQNSKTVLKKPTTAQESSEPMGKLGRVAYDATFLMGFGVVISVIVGATTNPVYGFGAALCFAWIFFCATIVKHTKSLARTIILMGLVGAVLYEGWTYIPRPEPKSIVLTFKDSTYITPAIKRRLNRDINGMRSYFEDLGIHTDSDLPPVTILEGDYMGGSWAS
jgi:hypothetical protein